jgi:AraC-like DNA-binding protein
MQQSRLFIEFRQAFEATTGLPLVLREAGSFRPPLEGSKRLNAFCALMTKSNGTCAACLQMQQRVEEDATRKAATLTCHAGMAESAVPVRVRNQVLCYLQTGQVFLTKPSRERLKLIAPPSCGEAAGVVPREWESAYFRTRVVTRKQYQMALKLLSVFAEHLAIVSNQLCIDSSRTDPPLVTKSRAFIAEHHCEPIHLRDVARAVSMSPSYFCRMFRCATGQTFTVYLARVRVESVKEMLLDADKRISEAAYAGGFQSLSQFNRLFHRITGEAPSRYRDRLHGRKGKAPRTALPSQKIDRDLPSGPIDPIRHLLNGSRAKYG